jgi:hypothetical protein
MMGAMLGELSFCQNATIPFMSKCIRSLRHPSWLLA